MSSIGTVRTWLSAHDKFRKCRYKYEGRPTARGTRLVISHSSPTREWSSGECVFAIQYHSTEVVRFYPNGDVGVNLNDWDTKTTKARVHEHADASIWSRKGESLIVWGWSNTSRKVLPIDISKEYVIQRDGGLRLPDGRVLHEGAVRCAQPRPASKTRNRVMNPAAGEVLVSPDGVPYILFSENTRGRRQGFNAGQPERTKTLQRYLGDYDLDRDYVFVGEESFVMNELFALTLGEWTSGSRFVRSFDN